MKANDTITPAELRPLLGGATCQVVDVREPVEHAEERLDGALCIPLGDIEKRCGELDRSRPIIIHCRGGVRGGKALEKLSRLGFTGVRNLEGGLEAWKQAGYPVVTTRRKVLPLMRQVQVTIGVCVLAGSILAWTVDPRFVAIPAFFGAGLTFAGLSGWCGLAILLSKMPWNASEAPCKNSCSV